MITPIQTTTTNYDLRGVDLSFVNADVIEITKKEDSGQESTLIVDTSQQSMPDRISTLKLCAQYQAPATGRT